MNIEKKIKFSDRVGIQEIEENLEFLDIYLNHDLKVFVDPVLIRQAAKEEGPYQYLYERMVSNIDSFFGEIARMTIASESLKDSGILKRSGETQATHLGYSLVNSSGRGSSEKILLEVFEFVRANDLIEKQVIFSLDQTPVYVPNFREDRMSDLIISLIRHELAEFSYIQSEKHNLVDAFVTKDPIPVGYCWDVTSKTWAKKTYRLLNPDAEPVLLIPRRILGKNLIYSPTRYLSMVLGEKQEEYKNAGSPYNGKGKNGEVKPPPKKLIARVEVDAEGLKVKEYLLRNSKYFPRFERGSVHLAARNTEGLAVKVIEDVRKKQDD